MTDELEARKLALLASEVGNPPCLWWLSFCDRGRPAGSQFLGVVVTEAPGFLHAIRRTWDLGINPSGEAQGWAVEDVPAEFHDRLLTKADLEDAGLV